MGPPARGMATFLCLSTSVTTWPSAEHSTLAELPLPITAAPAIPPSPASTAPSAPDAAHMAATTEQTSSATLHSLDTPPPSTPAGSVHSDAANTTTHPADPVPTHPNTSPPQPQLPRHHRRREHGRRRRRRRHHRKHSRGRRTHRQPRTTHQHRSSRHHRSRSPSTSYYSYSRSSSPSCSRIPDQPSLFSPTPIHFSKMPLPTSHNPLTLPFQLFAGSSTPGEPHHTFSRKPHKSNWRFWMDYHADQFDTPNKRQHARLLLDSGLTYKDICDYRQFTHIKWNDTTSSYDIFHFNCISIPSLSQKAQRRFPPPATRATSTSPELVHINASHTGPVGNISSILQQGRFLPSALHFPNKPGFFAQGVRITQQLQHDNSEHARVLQNLAKNTHSILITLADHCTQIDIVFRTS